MESLNALAVLVGAIGGGTGLAATLTAIFQYRKYKAEADAARVANEQTEMEYIKQSFKELNEETKKQFSEFRESAKAEIKSLHEEIDKLKESNSVLDAAVKDLNYKLSSLMSWVEGDNKRYRDVRLGRPLGATTPVPAAAEKNTKSVADAVRFRYDLVLASYRDKGKFDPCRVKQRLNKEKKHEQNKTSTDSGMHVCGCAGR